MRQAGIIRVMRGTLAAVLAKQFADRQIMPRPDVILYLVTRMDRSFAAAWYTS